MSYNEKIHSFLASHPQSSRPEIAVGIGFSGSAATLKRILAEELASGIIVSSGQSRSTRYSLAVAKEEPAVRKYPDGIQTFEKIVSEGYVYVDKTALVYKLANSSSAYVFLSRPRRFGKSLLISTLEAYFEGRAELFRDSAIYNLEKEWTRYPVVRLDLSTAGNSLDSGQLYTKLGNILRENEEALGLPVNETIPGERLEALVRGAYSKYGHKVVILIDEYDAPLLDTIYDEKLYPEFRRIVKELFSPIKKLDPYLRFTLLTGITKFSQMSIFSTLNNLNDISLDDEFSALCGFTEAELQDNFGEEICKMAETEGVGREIIVERLRQQYDGYRFSPSGDGIYNPFSILRAFSKMQMSDYWFASGTPGLLLDTLKRFDTDIMDIDGVEVMPSLFNQPAESVNNAVSIFYQSGYLTIKDYNPHLDTYILGIPNAEVRAGLMENLLPVTLKKNPIESQNLAIQFKRALLQNDVNRAMEVLKAFFASIPYPEFGGEALETFEKKEAYFKRLFYLVFSFMNIQIYTEVMNSEGRTDAIMVLNDAIYVIEAKLDAASAKEALMQIEENGYATRFAASGRSIFKLGINFSSKTRTISDWCIDG